VRCAPRSHAAQGEEADQDQRPEHGIDRRQARRREEGVPGSRKGGVVCQFDENRARPIQPRSDSLCNPIALLTGGYSPVERRDVSPPVGELGGDLPIQAKVGEHHENTKKAEKSRTGARRDRRGITQSFAPTDYRALNAGSVHLCVLSLRSLRAPVLLFFKCITGCVVSCAEYFLDQSPSRKARDEIVALTPFPNVRAILEIRGSFSVMAGASYNPQSTFTDGIPE
jgi:hypothetical protein